MLESVIRSIDFIEENLRSPLSVETIAAQAANYSPYHFVRVFSSLTGETPGSYLRKRRLSEAAQALVNSNRPLVEIAAEFQFQSHAAFTRSFKAQFGLPPAEHRRTQKFLHLAPRAVVLQSEFGHPPGMEPRLVDFPALHLVGVRYHGDSSGGELERVWQQFGEKMAQSLLAAQPRRTFGLWVYPDSFQTSRDFDYLAGLAVEGLDAVPQGMVERRLAARRYAVFEHVGSLRNIRRTYVYAYGEWLPHSGLKPAAQYDLEGYDERFTGPDRGDSILSILIPVE
ncbi:MAG: GyrI-like domain-containing protein [Anaerolineaceae bacterium]|nr:GyrI-like domain-containing protein [Anaerolineaceae bacterium]